MSKIQNHTAPVSQRPRTADRLRKGTTAARRVLRGLLAPVPTTRPAVTPARAAVPAAAQPVPDPAGLFAADELPPLADIAAAAEKFLTASEQARAADRTKRGARKILDRLPAGRYGMHVIERVESARETIDIDAIRVIFEARGLGPVPVKPCAPSLKVQFAPAMVEAAL